MKYCGILGVVTVLPIADRAYYACQLEQVGEEDARIQGDEEFGKDQNPQSITGTIHKCGSSLQNDHGFIPLNHVMSTDTTTLSTCRNHEWKSQAWRSGPRSLLNSPEPSSTSAN